MRAAELQLSDAPIDDNATRVLFWRRRGNPSQELFTPPIHCTAQDNARLLINIVIGHCTTVHLGLVRNTILARQLFDDYNPDRPELWEAYATSNPEALRGGPRSTAAVFLEHLQLRLSTFIKPVVVGGLAMHMYMQSTGKPMKEAMAMDDAEQAVYTAAATSVVEVPGLLDTIVMPHHEFRQVPGTLWRPYSQEGIGRIKEEQYDLAHGNRGDMNDRQEGSMPPWQQPTHPLPTTGA